MVVADALDRLSRDQEGVAALYKQRRIAGLQLVTLPEGEMIELHVGLKGTINALVLKDPENIAAELNHPELKPAAF